MRTVDAGETVMVPAEHLQQLLTTLTRWPIDDPDVYAAVHDAAQAVNTQPDDAAAYLLDAETAWWLQYKSDALSTFDLDESADESYRHPAVLAEQAVFRLLADEAPVTDRGLSAVTAAEIELMLAHDD